jgi:hypothetical protein
MENQIIERFGGLLKEELLSCVEKEFRLAKTCLLESISPFAGYYPQKGNTSPHYLYIMLEDRPTYWKVALAVENIRSKVDYTFDGVFAEISLSGDRNCIAVRVRNLPEYNLIHDLQKRFYNEGLELKKKTTHVKANPALIRLEKFYYLESWGDGLYLDRQQDHHGYFIIPEGMDWQTFKRLTAAVSTDVNLLFFDAALGYFFENKKIINFIRVYREQITTERLKAIRDKYLMLLNGFSFQPEASFHSHN